MTSIQDSRKFFANNAMELIDHDPDVDTAVDVKWVAFKDFFRFAVGIMRTVGTGAVDGFKILGNTEEDGSGTDVTLKVHAVGSEPDAVEDQLFLEVTAEEAAQEASDAGVAGIKGISAQIEFATATDEMVVVYVRSKPRFPQDALTADSVA